MLLLVIVLNTKKIYNFANLVSDLISVVQGKVTSDHKQYKWIYTNNMDGYVYNLDEVCYIPWIKNNEIS